MLIKVRGTFQDVQSGNGTVEYPSSYRDGAKIAGGAFKFKIVGGQIKAEDGQGNLVVLGASVGQPNPPTLRLVVVPVLPGRPFVIEFIPIPNAPSQGADVVDVNLPPPDVAVVLPQDELESFATVRQQALDAAAAATSAKNEAAEAAARADAAAERVSALSGDLYVSGNLTLLVDQGGYIRPDGTITPDPNWKHTKPIRISPGVALQVDVVGHPSVATLLYRDAAGTILASLVSQSSEQARVLTTSVAPANAATVELTTGNPTYSVFAALGSANKVTLVVAGEERAKEYTTNLLGSGNLMLATTEKGYYRRDGTLTPDPNWVHSRRIAVTPGTWYAVDLVGHPSVASLLFRDASGTAIPAGIISVPDADLAVLRGQYVAPPGAATLEISTGKSGVAANDALGARQLVAQGTGLQARDGDDLALLATRVGYLDPSGVIHADPTWRYSDPIIGTPGYRLQVDLPTQNAAASVSFYEDAAATVFKFSVVAPFYDLGVFIANIPWPAGVAAARVCYYANPNLANYPLASRRTVMYTSAALAMRSGRVRQGDVVVAYGDSRSSSDYPALDRAYTRALGSKTLLTGWPGHTVAQCASDADLARLFALPAPKVVVYLPGGNDAGNPGSVGTFAASSPNGAAGEAVVPYPDTTKDYPASGGTTFVQAVYHAVSKMVFQYADIRTRANLSGGESQNVLNGKMGAVVQPIIILCTDLPQQRNNAGDPFSQSANWERKRQAILEVGRLISGVRVVDTMRLFPARMPLEPFFTVPTDIYTNRGVLTMDGLHPNEIGDTRLADIVIAEAGL